MRTIAMFICFFSLVFQSVSANPMIIQFQESNISSELDEDAFKRYGIDTWITDSNGCKFHLTGWIDVGWGGVSGCDIHMDGDCGNYHFQGLIAEPCPECTITPEEIDIFLRDLVE